MTEPAAERFVRLLDVMRRLRSPTGCPWDREQTHQTLAPYLLEETYEVVAAIEGGDAKQLEEELGDVLFEVVFLAQLSAERGDFDISDALAAVTDKLIRRHPHVFDPDGVQLSSPAEVVEQWDAIKARERAGAGQRSSALDGVPEAMPALLRANKLGARAATVGFDWRTATDVLQKVDEEIAELKNALDDPRLDRADVQEELGDLLFALANLCRKLDFDPESTLRGANDKFTARFHAVEQNLAAEGRGPRDLTLDELEQEWTKVKRARPAR